LDLGLPVSIRTEDEVELNMNALVRDSVKDDQHVFVILQDEGTDPM